MKSSLLLGLLILLGIVGAIFLWRMRGSGENSRRDSYEPSLLLDVTEQKILRHLMATFPDRFVLAKVPLLNVIQVDRSSDRKRARERLNGMIAQFAVCGSEGFAQIVFEMETPAARKSLNFEKQLKRKYALLKNAGVPMVRVKSSDIPSPGEFRKQLDFAVQQRIPQQVASKPAYPSETASMSMPMGVTTVMNGPNTPLKAAPGKGEDNIPDLASALGLSVDENQRTLH